ncbi:MAG: cyclic nucleotide-binding/CBS domain-containing protein [Candidatus Bathyarchaeia archaeon]
MEKFPTVVGDLMSSPVIKIDYDANVRDASLLMKDKEIGSLIVTHRGMPVGILTERDLLERVVAFCRDPCDTRVGEVMSSPIISIERDQGILVAIRQMRQEDIGRLVVTDGEEVIGVVSEKDILRGVSLASLTSFSTLLRIS